MCKAARKADSLSGQEQLRVFGDQHTMGIKHVTLGWSKTLWTHMWIEHMYAYVANWGTLARFSCFSLEGSHIPAQEDDEEQWGGKLVAGHVGAPTCGRQPHIG